MADALALVPVPVTVTRWRCPLCKRTHAARKAAREHVARRWLNPAARACKTCAHFTDVPGGEPCVPGEPCDCNRGFQQCEAGVADVAGGRIVSSCPLWQLKEADL